MTKNFLWMTTKTGFLFFIFFVLNVSCTKENVPEPVVVSNVDNIQGKTVRYTVLVVPSGYSSIKSTDAIDSTYVSIVMNDSIYSKVADINGLATFDNLAAGVTAVSIKRENYTTANYIVDLKSKTDTDYDSQNLRNAATMVVLFPLVGAGTATISGRTFADLDLTNVGLEIAPANLQISSIIESNQLINYVNHSGDGEILSLSYSPIVKQAVTNSGSDYSITVPATGSGLKIIVKANDFQYNQTIGVGTLLRKIYRSEPDTIIAISGMSYFVDIDYN